MINYRLDYGTTVTNVGRVPIEVNMINYRLDYGTTVTNVERVPI